MIRLFLPCCHAPSQSRPTQALLTLLHLRARSGPGADQMEEFRLEGLLDGLSIEKSSAESVQAFERNLLSTHVTVSALLRAFPSATSTLTVTDMIKVCDCVCVRCARSA